MDESKKQIILKKLDLTERGAMFILENEELCDRIIEEDVIWTEDFIEKYGVSKTKMESYIKRGMLTYFSNYELQKGCKKYLFEKEAVEFYKKGLFHEGYYSSIKKTAELVVLYSRFYLTPYAHHILKLSFIDGVPNSEIAEILDTSEARVGEVLRSSHRKMKRYVEQLETFDELQKSVSELKYEELILQKNVAKLKKELPPEAIEKLSGDLLHSRIEDLNISPRLKNILADIEIETLFDLTMIKRSFLEKCRNMGKKTLRELDELMQEHNLVFVSEFDEPIKLN